MSAPLRSGEMLTPLERKQFQTPAQLRAEAVGQGRLADYAKSAGDYVTAKKHINRARDLTLAALALEESGVLGTPKRRGNP